MRRFALLFILLSTTSSLLAQDPLPLEVTILKIDAFAGTVTMQRNETKRDFPVDEETQITVAGEDAGLADLKPGTKANILYDSATMSVTAISVPEVLFGEFGEDGLDFQMVTELGHEPTTSLTLSPDGLKIYWDRDGSTWGATRRDRKPTTPFKNPRKLCAGRHVTFGGDIGIVLLKRPDREHETLHVFDLQRGHASRAQEIKDLVPSMGRIFSPYLALQGRLLCFSGRINGPQPYVYESKQLQDGSWQAPRQVLDDLDLSDGWTWPWLSEDGKTLIATNEGATVAADEEKYPHNIFVARRNSLDERFTNLELLELPGIDAMWCRAARYVPDSQELFVLAQPRAEIRTPTHRIAVVRGIDLSPQSDAQDNP